MPNKNASNLRLAVHLVMHYCTQPSWLATGEGSLERYHNALLGHLDIHPGPRGGQPRAHNVSATEDELDGTLVHLHVREEKWVCNVQWT